MGLDMYLYKKTYVKNWSHSKVQHKITVKVGNKNRYDIKPERINYIVEEVAYWRKFNALHNWFVENCADGEDNCQEVYVGEDKLREVIEVMKTVKASFDKSGKKTIQVETGWANGEKTYGDVEVFENTEVADDLFPTQSGFFFGGTEYDQYYYEDLCESITTLEALLLEPKQEGCYSGEFYYRASW